MGQSDLMVHDFYERLNYSEMASDEPFWDAVYKKAFPNMIGHILASGNTNSQRMGIDRVIFLSSGKSLYIDEKKREREYDDILLEYISIDTTGAPGWIEKDLLIDYLAYAFMPSKTVYLFPWDMLRRAWNHYKEEWKSIGPIIEAQNNGYKTISVAVPIKKLRTAVSNAAIIKI